MLKFFQILLAIVVYSLIIYALVLLTKAVGFVWILWVLATVGVIGIVAYFKITFGDPWVG